MLFHFAKNFNKVRETKSVIWNMTSDWLANVENLCKVTVPSLHRLVGRIRS